MSVIKRGIFGHNCELTRYSIYGGLSGEKINNRKLANRDETGFPTGFYPVRTPDFCGIGQTSEEMYFRSGFTYEVRIRVSVKRDTTVRCTLAQNTGFSPLLVDRAFDMKASDTPETVSFTFRLPDTVRHGKFEVLYPHEDDVEILALSIMDANRFFGLRYDVLNLLKRMKPAFLRYPGGCFAEFFDWKNTLLPVDERTPVAIRDLPFVLPDTHWSEPCDLGLNEFMELCRFVGAEPALTVRMSENDTVREAADLVEYCNGSVNTHWGKIRADLGYPEPFHVRIFFIGNELFGFGRGDAHDPHKAGELAKQVVAAMTAVDPSIQVTQSTGLNDEWDDAFLETEAPYDALSFHLYIRDRLSVDTPPEDILKAVDTVLYPALKDFHDRHNAPAISYDEWNYCWGESGSTLTGLYAARVLHMLMKHQDDLNIMQAAYFQPVNEGAIQATPFGVRMCPDGFVFEQLSGHIGHTPVKADCRDGIVDVFASERREESPDGTGHVTVEIITAINTDLNRSQPFVCPEGTTFLSGCTLSPENGSVLDDTTVKEEVTAVPQEIAPCQILCLALKKNA